MNQARPLSRGIHHLALNTDDMKMTLDFYVGVLGMPLVHALKVPPGLPHVPAHEENRVAAPSRAAVFHAGAVSVGRVEELKSAHRSSHSLKSRI